MTELLKLIDFLKSKGFTDLKLPIDFWVAIIEFYGQKSINCGLNETQDVRQNEQTKEVCAHPKNKTWQLDNREFCEQCDSWLKY